MPLPITATGWSGLSQYHHGLGLPNELINGRPQVERLQDLFQKREYWGYGKSYISGAGTAPPATRRRGDYTVIPATQNTMDVPGSAGGVDPGRSPPNRDVTIDNAHGDVRPLSDDATAEQPTDADADYVVQVRQNFEYAADGSGNGAPPLTPAVP